MDSFWPTYIMFELRKYRGVIIHDTEEWCKVWRKIDLSFEKWHEEFGKFSPVHLKMSKLGLWWCPFVQNRKCMSLKFTEELCVMTMKNDAKFKEKLTCHFKIDMRNLTNFHPSTLILYVRDNLEDKSMLFTHFYLCQEKNRYLACISSKQVINR